MKKLLVLVTFSVALIFPILAQELVWEKMHKESEGGWAEDIAVVNGKVWLSTGRELFVSKDNGQNWSSVLTAGKMALLTFYGSPNYSFGADRKIIVAGDSIFFGDHFSPDNGETWSTWAMSASTLPKYYLEPTILLIQNKKLYLGTYYNGFFQSSDLGKTFTIMSQSYPSSYGYYDMARTMEFFNGQPVIATYNNLYRWNGTNWVKSACNGLPVTVINTANAKLIDRIRFLNSKWIVSTNFGIYYSNDQGANFQRFNDIPQLTNLGTWDLYSSPAVFYNLDVMNGKIMVSYESNIYISADGGATWKHAVMEDRVDVKRIVSVGSNFLAATSGGVYRSTDGGSSWQKFSKGFERQYFTAIYPANGEGFFATAGAGIFKTSERGKTLAAFNNGIDFLRYVRINAVLPNKIISTQVRYYSYAGVSVRWDYTLYHSGNDNPQWNVLDTLPVKSPYIITASPNGTLAVSGSNPLPGGKNDISGYYTSADNGESWKKVFTGVTNTGKSYEDNVTSMLFEDDTVYVGTTTAGIYKSSDKGETWEAINTGLNLPNLADSLWWQDTTVLTDITTIKRFKKDLYAIGENYNYYGYGALHRSTDGGKHWVKKDFTSLGPAYAGLFPSGLIISENGTLYARLFTKDWLETHLAVSHDNGDSWEIFAEDFPDNYMHAFEVVGDYIYASGNTGLWRLNNPDSIHQEEQEEVVTKITDEERHRGISIHPNPFINQVTVVIPAARDGQALVEIFTSDGRRISKKEYSLETGDNNLVWNGHDDAGTMSGQGLYLVRVTHNQRTTTRKIIKH